MSNAAYSQAARSRLTEGSVGRHLVRLIGPLAWAILATMAFNLADVYFVGQLGPDPLAAIGFSFPVVMVVMGFTLGLSIATSSVLSRARGEDADDAEIARMGTASLMLSVILTVAVMIVGIATLDPLFLALGAAPRLLRPIHDFMLVWYAGCGALIIGNVAASGILRAAGDTLTPSLIMIGAALLNIALDPVLIFGLGPVPGMGIRGAALATVATRVMAVAAVAWVIHRRGDLVRFRGLSAAGIRAAWKRVLWVAMPAALTNLVSPLAIAMITAVVAQFGSDAVAGFGVASRVETLAVVPLLAATAGLGPLVGQNWGAQRFDRVWRTLELCYGFSMGWGVLVAVILALTAPQLMSWFSSAEPVQHAGSLYLYLVPISYGAYGIIIITNAACNAIGRPIFASALNVARTFLVYVPVAWIVAQWFNLEGVYGAAFVANAGIGLAAFLFGRRLFRGQMKNT